LWLGRVQGISDIGQRVDHSVDLCLCDGVCGCRRAGSGPGCVTFGEGGVDRLDECGGVYPGFDGVLQASVAILIVWRWLAGQHVREIHENPRYTATPSSSGAGTAS